MESYIKYGFVSPLYQTHFTHLPPQAKQMMHLSLYPLLSPAAFPDISFKAETKTNVLPMPPCLGIPDELR